MPMRISATLWLDLPVHWNLYGQGVRHHDRDAIIMELTVLTVPDCPNGPLMLERLAEALADHPGARLVGHVVHDEADAVRSGMNGSPTLLVDGVDPFAAPGTSASVSCRIYRGETGHTDGAPSVAALRLALRRATAESG
jgi:hypothetical protein